MSNDTIQEIMSLNVVNQNEVQDIVSSVVCRLYKEKNGKCHENVFTVKLNDYSKDNFVEYKDLTEEIIWQKVYEVVGVDEMNERKKGVSSFFDNMQFDNVEQSKELPWK